MSIKYLCYYDLPTNTKNNRRYPLSAAPIVDYVTRSIEAVDKVDVEIISAAATNNMWPCLADNFQISELCSLKTFTSLGRANRIISSLDRRWINQKIYNYLAKTLSTEDTLIVYHSIYYMDIVEKLRKKKKFNLIIQVEEIYADVMNDNNLKNREMKYFSCADSYIFATENLNQIVNTYRKPYVSLYGCYSIVPEKNVKPETDDIHIVYAGTLDRRKGGAAAAAAAEFLSAGYHMHILGFGTDAEVDEIGKIVQQISGKTKARITYDGVLTGDAYVEFLQRCSIGVCTQDPSSSFNDTSFPSKILSYLGNGLRVVSIRTNVISESPVGSIINFYDKQTPEQIALAIKNVNICSPYDSRKHIELLNDEFQKKLFHILVYKGGN